MLCDMCKKNEATVRLIAMVDGTKMERNLCTACVAKQRMQLRTEGVQSIISAILEGASRARQRHPDLRCSACGTEYEDFAKTNRLGCSQCYKDFAVAMKPLLSRLHGHAEHVGRTPEHMGTNISAASHMEKLRRQLEMAIAMEEFEQAAELRDTLRELGDVRGGGDAHA